MPEEKESLKARLGSEMRSAFYLTLYFGVWFSALNLLVHETLGRSGLPLEAWAFAWIKAALCAKFVLVGEMLVPMPINLDTINSLYGLSLSESEVEAWMAGILGPN